MSTHHSLTACIVRLAHVQQQAIDTNALMQAIHELGQRKQTHLVELMHQLCTKMAIPLAKVVRLPDPADMPLLGHQTDKGWFVVRGMNAQRQWVIDMWDSKQAKLVETVLPDPKITGLTLFRFSLKEQIDTSESPVYQLIRREIHTHQRKLAVICIGSVTLNLLAIATSLYTMQIYNRVIPSSALQTLTVLTIGVCISILFEWILKHARSRIYDSLVESVDQRLSRAVFLRLLSIRMDQMPASLGSMASQLNAYQSIRAFMTSLTTHLLVDVPFVLLFLMLIPLIAHSYLVIVPVFFFLAACVIGMVSRQKIENLILQSTSLTHAKTGLLVEAIEGAETIKSGQSGWRMLNRWMHVSDAARESELDMRRITERNQHTTATMQQLSYVALVATGAVLIAMGEMTMGGLVACTILAGRILSPVSLIPSMLMQWGQVKATVKGLDRMWSLESDHPDQTHPMAPEVIQGHFKLEDISTGYHGTQKALQLRELVIRPGEKVGILGTIGSGKTTLLRLLSGMYKPHQGRVLLDQLDISQISKSVLADKLSFLQQEGRLFAGTLRENLILGMLDPGDQAILDMAGQTGLMQHVISKHPKGLMQEISEGGLGLSAGQKQLANLTRIFLRKPHIWLLDEPTSSMDKHTENQVLQALSQALKPTDTLVMVTHKSELLPLVDRLIVVANGQVVLDGPKDQVIAKLQNPRQAPHLRPVGHAS